MVTAALRNRRSFEPLLAVRGIEPGIALNPSMGVTPKQTSNLLYSRRNIATVRSFSYRRVEHHFAITAIWGSLKAQLDESGLLRGRFSNCTVFALESGKFLVRRRG